MAKTIIKLIIGLLFLSSLHVNAQDVIVKKDNSTILSKITKVSTTEIEFKKWSNLDGPTYIISISDVIRINYENGEYDIFETTQYEDNKVNEADNPRYVKGILEVKSGSKLTLNGNRLSDNEVRDLLGKEYYSDYQTGKRFLNAAGVLEVVFILTAIPAFYLIAGGIAGRNVTGLTFGLLFASVSVPCGILFGVFDGVGSRRIRGVVNEYNSNNTNFSLMISPTLINCEIPQLQNTYGVGVTLRANF